MAYNGAAALLHSPDATASAISAVPNVRPGMAYDWLDNTYSDWQQPQVASALGASRGLEQSFGKT